MKNKKGFGLLIKLLIVLCLITGCDDVEDAYAPCGHDKTTVYGVENSHAFCVDCENYICLSAWKDPEMHGEGLCTMLESGDATLNALSFTYQPSGYTDTKVVFVQIDESETWIYANCSDQKSVTLDATTTSAFATVRGEGTFVLQEDNNFFEITVIAENGNEKVYTACVTNYITQTPSPTPTATPSPKPEETPVPTATPSPKPVHQHTYQWEYDQEYHWQLCSCGDSTEWNEHSIVRGQGCYKCECGYVTHMGYISTQLTNDDVYHWTECDCGEDSFNEQHWDIGSGSCNNCGYLMQKQHNHVLQYTSDGHWISCDVEDCPETEWQDHEIVDSDTTCETCFCGYTRHMYYPVQLDDTYHQYVCYCSLGNDGWVDEHRYDLNGVCSCGAIQPQA